MRRRGWTIIALVALAALIVGGLAAFREPLALRAMARIYDQGMGRNPFADLPDGLHVGLCGSGGPMPDPTRAGPCVAVVAGKRLYIVDAGAGSVRNLSLMNLPPAEVQALFLTHYHSDHIAETGELALQRWVGGSAQVPLPVYGPPGLQEVADGFRAAYRADGGYRTAHHGPRVAPPTGAGLAPRAFEAPAQGAPVLVLEDNGLKVWAFSVDHHPVRPAVGYRFEYGGRSAVISGDASASAGLVAAARGADLLVHDALSPRFVAIQREAALKNGRTGLAKILSDIPGYHASPEDAARQARAAGVRALLLYHITPPVPAAALEGPFLGRAKEIFGGALRVGRDGDLMVMPSGGSEVRLVQRMRRFRF